MTVREWAEKSCLDRGMFPDQAKAVVDSVVAGNGPMAGRWDDRIDAYPAQVAVILSLEIDQAALAWIDANLPGAWFRPLFHTDAP